MTKFEQAQIERAKPHGRSALLRTVAIIHRAGSKRTQRLVAQRDIEKAIASVEKARDSLEGRRTLRLMGEVHADDVEDEEEARQAG